MIRILLLFLILTLLSPALRAQSGGHVRISLITCGPGDEEIWEVFGHTAVRVVDSIQHTDQVYNYGTFDFGPDFELQFMRGKLLYCVGVQEYHDFLQDYVVAKRSVEEQVLLLDTLQKEHVYDFLEWNAAPENKYYKYDFFFDNCATRIRDVFPRPEVFGKHFRFGNTLPPGQHLSFRDIINSYFYRDHWTRTGVNILLGSKIDRPMSNSDIMFLPDYLRDGIRGATVNGRRISSDPVLLLPGSVPGPSGADWPLLFTLGIALLTILGYSVPSLSWLGRTMRFLLLFTTGLLGCLILVMWFGTDHQACANNFNLLWCLPTNLILAFARPRGTAKYAAIAITCILLSLLAHLFKIQGLTLLEIAPLLLSLLWVFAVSIRKSQTSQNA